MQASWKHRDPQLDALRGVATLMVIVLHVVALSPNLAPSMYLNLVIDRLSNGVQLFFVLSGYLICLSYTRSIERGEGNSGYFLHRALKIVPLYLIFLFISITVFLINKDFLHYAYNERNSISSDNLTAGNIIVHVLFLQGLFPRLDHTLIDGSWSIVCELYFYLLFPVIFSITGRLRHLNWAILGSLTVGIAFVGLFARAPDGFSYYGFPAQLPCFLLGMSVYRIRDNEVLRNMLDHVAVPVFLISAIVFFGLLRLDVKPLPQPFLPSLCFAGILATADKALHRMPESLNRFLSAFGKRSYSLYFLHILVIKQILAISALRGYGVVWNLALTISISLVLSFLIFHRIDLYFVRLGHRISRRRSEAYPDLKTA